MFTRRQIIKPGSVILAGAAVGLRISFVTDEATGSRLALAVFDTNTLITE